VLLLLAANCFRSLLSLLITYIIIVVVVSVTAKVDFVVTLICVLAFVLRLLGIDIAFLYVSLFSN